MLAVSFGLGGLRLPRELRVRSVALGLGSAVLLYLIFVGGAAAVTMFHPFGITSASEASIYSLIASPSNPTPVQVAVLLFDAAGYEAFFRGVLQQKLGMRIGVGSAPLVALFDAGLHVITLNLLWVGATLITDLAWGLTFHYGKGKQASFTSHFVWDLAIFILRPVT
jgi:membrane protease YdiL (CAAX protease family)